MSKKLPFHLEFDAVMMKAALLSWCRFTRRLNYIATECGAFNSDVLAASEKEMIEVETKISILDLSCDFKNKNKHHFYFKKSSGHAERHIPNKFYFAVPSRIAQDALKAINSKKFNPWHETSDTSHYGLLSFDLNQFNGKDGGITVVQQARKIHSEPPAKKTLDIIQQRMSSELCTFHMKKFLDHFSLAAMIDTTKALVEIPDFEYTEEAKKDMVPDPITHKGQSIVHYQQTGETITTDYEFVEEFPMPKKEKPTKQQKLIDGYLKKDPEGSSN